MISPRRWKYRAECLYTMTLGGVRKPTSATSGDRKEAGCALLCPTPDRFLAGPARSRQLFAQALVHAIVLVGVGLTAVEAQPITTDSELWDQQQKTAERIVDDIHEYLDGYKPTVLKRRSEKWDRDFTSAEAYRNSIKPNLKRFRHLIGLGESRVSPVEMRQFGSAGTRSKVAETEQYTVQYVRWTAIDGVHGEGLLLTPKGSIQARVVALPDAGQAPEQLVGLSEGESPTSPFARRLVESGAQVIVPVLINRQSTFSGTDKVVPRRAWEGEDWESRQSDMPHREWVFRQAYVMGRHVIGYEVQKIQAALDWFTQQSEGEAKLGVAGYGEGGLLALYSTVVDQRVDAALVSGYFGPREGMAQEPIYRTIWGFLTEFGGAEVASMVTPRPLTLEYSAAPSLADAASGGLSGELETPSFKRVQNEIDRLRGFFPEDAAVKPEVQLVHEAGDTVTPGSDPALETFMTNLGMDALASSGSAPTDRRDTLALEARQRRQVREIQSDVMSLLRGADQKRYQFFANPTRSTTPEQWDQSMAKYRDHFWNNIIGKLPAPTASPNPRSRKVREFDSWTLHQVRLDVYSEVFAFGMLGLPKDMEPGEKRPVVVLQHGINGLPLTPIAVDSYNEVMVDLTERGFITFAPHNPYQGWIRRAFPLKLSNFSILVRQHQQIVDWLQTREHVADDRIGFYGKSWGGDAALRIPSIVKDYALSICSAMFNAWPRKAITPNYALSYMWSNSIEVWDFNTANTYGHYEMAAMIAPRPFMVEEGYQDSVAPEAWAGYEWGKVHRLYDLLKIKDRAEMGYFKGGHEIGKGPTYDFLHKHLDWPKPEKQ